MATLPTMQTGVTVTGTGAASTRPDIARATFSLQARGGEVTAALDFASTAMAVVLDALRAQGVDEADVSTDGLSVQPAWNNSGVLSGYECSQQLRVVLRELDDAGETLRAVAGAGGDQLRINELRLDIDDRTDAAAQAREAAFADARARAEQYATLAGRGLGAVVSVEESQQFGGAVPLGMRRVLAAPASPAVPIAAGGLEVQVSVQVRWALLG